MGRLVVAGLIACFVLLDARPALAIKEYGDVFKDMFMKPEEDEDYAKLVRKANCLVCHQGRKRTNYNPYGEAMLGMLDKEVDKEDVDKITEVIVEVNTFHTDPEDEESPTYGELIANKELPGGPLDVVKRDPPKEEDEDEDGDDDDSEDEDDESDDEE